MNATDLGEIDSIYFEGPGPHNAFEIMDECCIEPTSPGAIIDIFVQRKDDGRFFRIRTEQTGDGELVDFCDSKVIEVEKTWEYVVVWKDKE